MMRKINILVCVIAICVGGVFGWSQGRHRLITQMNALVRGYLTDQKTIDRLIAQHRYRAASEYISAVSKNRRQGIALASYLGEAMYRGEGLSSLGECFTGVDYDAMFGCLHGFLAPALSKGKSSYQSVYQACLSVPADFQTVCVHNIGHALASLGDYSVSAINASLLACEQFPNPGSLGTDTDRYGSCKTGVFMEYYTARMGAQGTGVYGQIVKDTDLSFNPQKPYGDCPLLADPDICYGQIVSWWLMDEHLPPTKVAALCQGIPDAGGQTQCASWLSRTIIATINDTLSAKVDANVGGSQSCQSVTPREARQACFQGRLIGPLTSTLSPLLTAKCQALQLGPLTSTCVTTINEWLASYAG